MSGRQAGVELFRILALINAYQIHGFETNRFFNATPPSWQWEYVVLIFCAIGITMTGLFQISPAFTLRSPFRAKGLMLFCLTIMAYTRTMAWFWKWLGFQDHTRDLRVRCPIVGCFSWFFTSHTQLMLMTPVLNKGMLGLSKREYFFVDIGIVACLV
jgi:hypothetical protein